VLEHLLLFAGVDDEEFIKQLTSGGVWGSAGSVMDLPMTPVQRMIRPSLGMTRSASIACSQRSVRRWCEPVGPTTLHGRLGGSERSER
jgi:hypothetical protein